MQHRHINSADWTLAAIDSLLERGDLPDWRDLFALVRADRELALSVLRVARAHRVPGASIIAEHLVLRSWPELGPPMLAGKAAA